ncbi:hypothetical protein JCM10213_007999 [Rhodosporidiobolus nylandii]
MSTLSAAQATPSITGTKTQNISSDSTQLTYIGTWRSDTAAGYYQAYSNASDAAVTFTFTGVAVSYVAEKKADRGICLIAVDDGSPTTLDLYNDSGYDQGQELLFTSDTLPYGRHNVTLSQAGPDARFGYYPYLVTETWMQVVPSDVAAYTATQIIPSPTAAPSKASHSSGSSTPAIAGGVVGAVVACALAGFLLYLWRREKKRQRRSEGAPVQKVKKADGKMAIEDEPAAGAAGYAYGPYGPHPPPPGGYGDPYAQPYLGYGYAPPGYASPTGTAAWASYPYHPSAAVAAPAVPPLSAHSTDSSDSANGGPGGHGGRSSVRYPSQASSSAPLSSPGFAPASARGSYYDSAYHSGGGSDGGRQAYPHHVQGNAQYAVPEI